MVPVRTLRWCLLALCLSSAAAAGAPQEHRGNSMKPNHLAGQSSPYLLQHRFNPVDWYPWGEEALSKAKRENKPIFLSIGYSSCHWCHVMAHESFEDGETAAYLNRHFVSIKVDREERPDIDALYMRAVVIMTGSGGWPLSVFLTPDLRPFFGGTYFPKSARFGVPSFLDVLRSVNGAYRERGGEVDGAADRILTALSRSFAAPSSESLPGPRVAESARKAILRRFDEVDGGFGTGPKFPQPPLLDFLLDEALRHPGTGLLEKVVFTLYKMEAGGVRDQVGGGFHRYSVDGEWRVPHYEKMLYDNAQLASLYFRTFELSGDEDLRRVGEEVLRDMEAEMGAEGGGFVAALDADSGGEEGSYYLWTPEEVKTVLGTSDGSLIAELYGLSGGTDLGSKTLHRTASFEVFAKKKGSNKKVFLQKVRALLKKLERARRARIGPGVDTKVLTDWNALAGKAFLDGYAATRNKRDLDTGLRTLALIWTRCWDGKTLKHVWDGRSAKVDGQLADYAYLALAHWRAYEVTGDPRHLHRVNRLLSLAVKVFRDPSTGLFYDNPLGAEKGGLILPVRDTDDGVLPSAMGVLAGVLWKWERLTSDDSRGRIFKGILRSEGRRLAEAPGAQPALAGLAAALNLPSVEVVVAWDGHSPSGPELLRLSRSASIPDALVLPLRADLMKGGNAQAYSLFEGRITPRGARAFVCVGGACRLPVRRRGELERGLEEARKRYEREAAKLDLPPRSPRHPVSGPPPGTASPEDAP